MSNTKFCVAALLLALSVPTLAFAQNGGNLNGRSEVGSTSRFTYTARSGRSATRGRGAEPKSIGSVRSVKRKGELGGLTTNSICIGCSAK